MSEWEKLADDIEEEIALAIEENRGMVRIMRAAARVAVAALRAPAADPVQPAPRPSADVLKVAVEALEPFASGAFSWGEVKAWIVAGAPDRQKGVNVAAKITRFQVRVDAALSAIREETGR